MILTGAGGTGGMIFQAGGLSFNGDGRVLDPPVVTAMEIHLGSPLAVADFTIGLWLVPEAVPDDYSGTLIPLGRSEVYLQSFDVVTTGAPFETVVSLSTASCDAVRAYVTSRSFWTGRIAISFEVETVSVPASSLTITAADSHLETTESAYWAGLIGGPYGGPNRFVRDGRFGMPAVNTQLVRDGDQTSLWVRPEAADPEDPTTEYRPRAGEGSIHDDLPELG